jgi:hypothetical protein
MFANRVGGTYRVIWQRVGGGERFRHFVTAETREEALRKSEAEVASALGPNVCVWEPVDVAEAVATALSSAQVRT